MVQDFPSCDYNMLRGVGNKRAAYLDDIPSVEQDRKVIEGIREHRGLEQTVLILSSRRHAHCPKEQATCGLPF